jgi:hypothetical protein
MAGNMKNLFSAFIGENLRPATKTKIIPLCLGALAAKVFSLRFVVKNF